MAERAVTVDILSDGRFELGTGGPKSFDGPGVYGAQGRGAQRRGRPPERSREKTRRIREDGLRSAVRIMTERPHLVRTPLQKPHPPLWRAGFRSGTQPAAVAGWALGS
jgi:alkanesulfonate monooxygenase SsuD/methylene tetrahydromethanopterin reductase-like flavin-dependent oxidoreductase (luciferase family)